MELIWSNAIMYNGAAHNVGKVATALRKVANKELQKTGLVGGALRLAAGYDVPVSGPHHTRLSRPGMMCLCLALAVSE